MLDRSSVPPYAPSSDETMRDASVMREEPSHHNMSMDTDWSMPEPSPHPEWNVPVDTSDAPKEDVTIIKEEEDSILDMPRRDSTPASVTQALPPRSTTSTRRPPLSSHTSHTSGTSALVSELAALNVNKPPAPAVASSTADSKARSTLTDIPAFATSSSTKTRLPTTVPAQGRHTSACNPDTLPVPKMEQANTTTLFFLARGYLVPGEAYPSFGNGEILTREEAIARLMRCVRTLSHSCELRESGSRLMC